MQPLQDVQFAKPSEETAAIVGRKFDASELWDRDGTWIGTKNGSWIQRYDYAHLDKWTAMFTPNGDGTIEWRLGWACTIPKDQLLLIFSEEDAQLPVPFGALTSDQLESMNSVGGISIPIKVTKSVAIQRNEPIARIAIVPKSILSVQAEFETEDA